jgi:hypothetical protein
MWLVAQNISASLSYCVEATFRELPDNDEALVEWLKTQPGIVPNTVHARRFGPERVELEVGFIQVRTMSGHPPFPNLEAKCAELGYLDPNGPFLDCKDRYR